MQMRKNILQKIKSYFFCQYLSFSVWFPLSLKHWSPLMYNHMKLYYCAWIIWLIFTDLFRIRIRSGYGKKFWILPDPHLQHCPKHCKKGTKQVWESSKCCDLDGELLWEEQRLWESSKSHAQINQGHERQKEGEVKNLREFQRLWVSSRSQKRVQK